MLGQIEQRQNRCSYWLSLYTMILIISNEEDKVHPDLSVGKTSPFVHALLISFGQNRVLLP